MTGRLKIRTVPYAVIAVYSADPHRLICTVTADINGETEDIALPAPDVSATFDPRQIISGYALYDVCVTAPNYNTAYIHGAEIVAMSDSTLPVPLIPVDGNDIRRKMRRVIHTYIRPPDGITETPDGAPVVSADVIMRAGGVHGVKIPKSITVHLGAPNANARNVTVPFNEYIANIASSEIYPTWHKCAVKANLHVIANFALNRIYTDWYRGKGWDFDITNNVGYDQYYVHGRNIFDAIQNEANKICRTYIRRIGNPAPLFTPYCNGTAAECSGLSQWGSQELAQRGLSETDILKYYFGEDIEIVRG